MQPNYQRSSLAIFQKAPFRHSRRLDPCHHVSPIRCKMPSPCGILGPLIDTGRDTVQLPSWPAMIIAIVGDHCFHACVAQDNRVKLCSMQHSACSTQHILQWLEGEYLEEAICNTVNKDSEQTEGSGIPTLAHKSSDPIKDLRHARCQGLGFSISWALLTRWSVCCERCGSIFVLVCLWSSWCMGSRRRVTETS